MNEPTQSNTKAGCPPVPQSIMTASRDELDNIQLQIEGELPEDLQGHVFIVAPVGTVASGGLPYRDGNSWLNGDGMIYRLDFNRQGEVRLKSRLVKPPCYYADKATQPGSKYEKYQFSNYGILRFSAFLGSRNELNTGFLPMKFSQNEPERLLVNYDAGRPYEIDTETLEIVTPVGANKEWRGAISLPLPFKPVFSTAHPVFETHTQEMFKVNYGRSLGSLLQATSLIQKLSQLPSEVEEFIKNIAKFWNDIFFKNFFSRFSPFFETIFQICTNLIEKIIGVEDFVHLVRWDGLGNLERWKLILPDGSPVKIKQTIHQIGVTRDYVVIMDTAFKAGLGQLLNNPFPDNKKLERQLANLLTHPVLPDSTIYIVPRDYLKPGQSTERNQREVEVVAWKVALPLPAAHFLVDYENPRGQITLHMAHICAWEVSEWVREYDVSAYSPHNSLPSYLSGITMNPMDISRMGRYVIDVETRNEKPIESKIISDRKCTWGVGMYTYRDRLHSDMLPGKLEDIYWTSPGLWKELMTKSMCDLYQDYQYQQVPLSEVLRLAEKGIQACLFRLHTSSMEIADHYKFPSGYTANSPQFVPRKDGEDSSIDGYIVCSVLFKNSNEFWIFDAKNLKQGPKCRLKHPSLKIGYTLHTAWLPNIGTRQASYNIPVRQDYQDLLEKFPYPLQFKQEVEELFVNEVYPHFDGDTKST
jgi:carotenoid cleavage dioxygenase-like enzyme